MKKYFLHNGTEQQGPFDVEDLKAKLIKKSTPIWYDGIDNWTTADKIDELKDLLKTGSPPPFNQESKMPPPREKPKVQTDLPLSKKKNNTGLIVTIILLVVVGVISLFYAANVNSGGGKYPGDDTYLEKVMTVEEMEKADPVKFLDAGGTYNENFWGTAMKIHGQITNNATVANYKDVTIEIVFYTETDTELERKQYTIYDFFNAHTTKTFELKVERPAAAKKCGWNAVQAIPY